MIQFQKENTWIVKDKPKKMVIRSKNDMLESRGTHNLRVVSTIHPPKGSFCTWPLSNSLLLAYKFSSYAAGPATHFRGALGSVILAVSLCMLLSPLTPQIPCCYHPPPPAIHSLSTFYISNCQSTPAPRPRLPPSESLLL